MSPPANKSTCRLTACISARTAFSFSTMSSIPFFCSWISCCSVSVWEFRSSLGVAIGHAALARPRTGTSEPLGRGPVTGGLGADCSYRTNELIGEDGTVIIRLVPVQYNGLDDCVASWGILMYHLDCCCSEHLPFGIAGWQPSVRVRFMTCDCTCLYCVLLPVCPYCL